jgi:hypothetical protein
VRGARDLHDHDRRRAGERAREPEQALEPLLRREEVEQLRDAHARQRAEEVPAEEAARLRERRVHRAVNQDRARALAEPSGGPPASG